MKAGSRFTQDYSRRRLRAYLETLAIRPKQPLIAAMTELTSFSGMPMRRSVCRSNVTRIILKSSRYAPSQGPLFSMDSHGACLLLRQPFREERQQRQPNLKRGVTRLN